MGIKDRFGSLPISAVADEVCASLDAHPRLVVTAPPGAGKSTLLPLALLEHISEGKMLMLEPRRIAARQVAARMASMLGQKLGDAVGYRVRFDHCVSAATRIEVITEGILERMLVDDPTLDGVAAVVFDEYHERSLSSDLALALVREIQNVVRPDLRILVMSATIDAVPLARVMDARLIDSPGRSYGVDITYGEDFEPGECAQAVAKCVRMAAREHDGNILAFLPGQADILKCRDLLEGKLDNAEVQTRYGAMPFKDQQRVMSPAVNGMRRVVLATPIAETSLTIDGITVVVDSGLCRTPVFEPSTGLSRLVTTRITKDMATQRAGRAGRLSAGYCYRLWSKATDARMGESRQPEIETADLCSMALTVSAWGEANPMHLPWVTPPPVGHLANARSLLRMLGATDEAGRLTERGKRIAQIPCHPRIAAMLTEAGPLAGAACDVAALLEDKDPLGDETNADLSARVEMLAKYRQGRMPSAWKRIDDAAAQYRRQVKASYPASNAVPEDIGRLVAMAYPERIAMRDDRGRYRLASGGSPVALHPADDLARHEFLAVASTGAIISLAAPIDREFVMAQATWKECATWSSRDGAAVVREELRLGQLVLATRQAKGNVRDKVAAAVAAAAPKEGLTMFDFNDDVLATQLRVAVASAWHPDLGLPDVSTERMLATAGEWLPLYIGSASTAQELRKIDMAAVTLGQLTYQQQQALDKIAPTHIVLPCGRNARVHYRRGADAPVVRARLQDCFGMMETPRVDEGRRPVLMELLSPGFKPVQLTQDMAGFWSGTYHEVRKELRRRYPKHNWPENP